MLNNNNILLEFKINQYSYNYITNLLNNTYKILSKINENTLLEIKLSKNNEYVTYEKWNIIDTNNIFKKDKNVFFKILKKNNIEFIIEKINDITILNYFYNLFKLLNIQYKDENIKKEDIKNEIIFSELVPNEIMKDNKEQIIIENINN